MKNLHRHLYNLTQTIRAGLALPRSITGKTKAVPARSSGASNAGICSPGLGAVAMTWNRFVILAGNFMRVMGRL
jgi:hypothetical protein